VSEKVDVASKSLELINLRHDPLKRNKIKSGSVFPAAREDHVLNQGLCLDH
jgi:hypothetical protein